MSITSFTFMLFVGVSLCIYFVMPAKWQWVVLLVDNLIFYFFNATPYTFIYLGVGIVSTYMAALFFEKMDIKMQNLAKEEKAIFEKKKKRTERLNGHPPIPRKLYSSPNARPIMMDTEYF